MIRLAWCMLALAAPLVVKARRGSQSDSTTLPSEESDSNPSRVRNGVAVASVALAAVAVAVHYSKRREGQG